jgi:hypothetical protein
MPGLHYRATELASKQPQELELRTEKTQEKMAKLLIPGLYAFSLSLSLSLSLFVVVLL